MNVSKSKLFLYAIIAVLLNNSFSYTQIKDCDITFLDSNHVRKSYYIVSLNSFKSDTLVFSDSKVIHRIAIQNLARLGYKADSKTEKAILIGAGIGFSIVVIAAILLSGSDGHPDYSLSVKQTVLGGFVLGVIGGVIGGLSQANKKEYVTVDF